MNLLRGNMVHTIAIRALKTQAWPSLAIGGRIPVVPSCPLQPNSFDLVSMIVSNIRMALVVVMVAYVSMTSS